MSSIRPASDPLIELLTQLTLEKVEILHSTPQKLYNNTSQEVPRVQELQVAGDILRRCRQGTSSGDIITVPPGKQRGKVMTKLGNDYAITAQFHSL